MAPIEWHRSPEDSRVGRLLGVVAMAPILGVLVALLGALVVFLPSFVRAALADPALLVLFVVLALVGGPASLLYLWPILTDPSQRAGLGVPVGLDLSWRYLLASAVLGLVGHAAAVAVSDVGPMVFLAVCSGGGFFAVGLVSSAGRIDPEARTLDIDLDVYGGRDGGREVDLDAWVDLRRCRLGDVVFLYPTYAPGHRGPRLLSLPAAVDERARPVFEAALAAPVEASEREPNPLAQGVLVAFAALFVAVGIGASSVDALPGALRLYAVVGSGGVALLFLAVAYRGG